MVDPPASRSAPGSTPGSYTLLVAQELGLPAGGLAPLLDGTDLDEGRLRRDDAALSPRQQICVLDNALRLAEDPCFGFRMGRRLTIAAHGPLGFLVSSCSDLRSALEAAQDFASTRVGFLRLALVEQDDALAIDCVFDVAAPPEVERCMAEALSVVVCDLAGFILGRPAAEIETWFPHHDPGTSAHDWLPGPVHFDGGGLCVRVPHRIASTPNASASHAMHDLARTQCEALSSELGRPAYEEDSTRRRLERLLLSSPTRVPSEDEAAAELFVSARTLARRLANEGTGFREVRDDLLARRATGHLADGLPVATVAHLLGYHDASGFRRAFKRWCGVTPEAWRRSSTP
ncbi:AraC family transcriptional regulator [Nocardioidaceae bacterium]|nr:AraC family transcriptional regulator [Nocardioidaceae bacterium]